MSFREVHVANTFDLRDGEMKEVAIDKVKILLARVGDNFHAVTANCPHYGAPLAKGVLCGSRVVCPWHHSVFNMVNGDLEDPPALDSLISYSVRVEGEQIFVSLPEEIEDRRTPAMVKRDTLVDSRHKKAQKAQRGSLTLSFSLLCFLCLFVNLLFYCFVAALTFVRKLFLHDALLV